jgi:hypothetical protein
VIPTEPPATTTDLGITTAQSDRPSFTGKKGLLAAAVLFVACAAACSLPLLLAGGAAIGAGAATGAGLFSGAGTIAAALLFATAFIGVLLWRRRSQNPGEACGGNCGC